VGRHGRVCGGRPRRWLFNLLPVQRFSADSNRAPRTGRSLQKLRGQGYGGSGSRLKLVWVTKLVSRSGRYWVAFEAVAHDGGEVVDAGGGPALPADAWAA
jgi:hypothetical protein